MTQNTLYNLIKKPLVITGLSVLIFASALFLYLQSIKFKEAQEDVKVFVSRWKYNLGENLHYNKEQEFVKTILDQLKEYPISKYELLKGEQVLESWPENSNEVTLNCKYPVESLLTLRGVYVGQINTCISEAQIKKATLFSPLFTVVLVFATGLLFFVGFLPLFSYKASLLRLARSIRDWNKNNNKELEFHSDDKLTNEILEMVQEGTESRLELVELQSVLENEKSISRAAKRMAHDVRSPVSSLQRLNMELSDSLPEVGKAILGSVIDRMNRVVNDMLNEQSGYFQENLRLSDASVILDKILKEKSVNYKNIKFQKETVSSFQAFFVTEKLERILSNIIKNAIDSYDGKKGEIEVSLDSDDKYTTIKIKDFGKGISPKHLPFLFEENFSYGKKSGHGLGLSAAKFWVNSWGGFIQVDSEVNKGTEFRIVLRNSLAMNEISSDFKNEVSV